MVLLAFLVAGIFEMSMLRIVALLRFAFFFFHNSKLPLRLRGEHPAVTPSSPCADNVCSHGG